MLKYESGINKKKLLCDTPADAKHHTGKTGKGAVQSPSHTAEHADQLCVLAPPSRPDTAWC